MRQTFLSAYFIFDPFKSPYESSDFLMDIINFFLLVFQFVHWNSTVERKEGGKEGNMDEIVQIRILDTNRLNMKNTFHEQENRIIMGEELRSLVAFLNGISTFLCYSMPKPWCCLISSWNWGDSLWFYSSHCILRGLRFVNPTCVSG